MVEEGVKMTDSEPRVIFSGIGALMAIFVPRDARTPGIQFLTSDENNFQVGLMSRSENTPVLLHAHNPVVREIIGTQEFLWIRRGKATVRISATETAEKDIYIEMKTGDSILLANCSHAINFDGECEILEVKQGPYNPSSDKKYDA
jgi:hypothetical protein